MIINNTILNADAEEIIHTLQFELHKNGIQLLNKIQDSGKNIQVCCPYHNNGQERRPSAGIKKSDGTFHCFACNETHSLPEMISYCFGKYDDMLGKFGWKWLVKNFATISVEERKDVEIDLERNNTTRKSSILADTVNTSNGRVSEEELDSYRYYHPYWEKRHITNKALIELFDLGYDEKTDCITFPVRDKNGNCLFVARRSVNTKYFNYPAGVKKPLYGEYEYRRVVRQTIKNLMGMRDCSIDTTEVIVCESMLDALTAWQYGKVAVALNGVGTQQQYKDLEALPCRKLILATDNDDAGQKARERIRKNVKNKLITEYILPRGKKDLNELEKHEFNVLEEIF